MKNIVYIGMDVHRNSYSLSSIEGATGEVLGEIKIASDVYLIKINIQHVLQHSIGPDASVDRL